MRYEKILLQGITFSVAKSHFALSKKKTCQKEELPKLGFRKGFVVDFPGKSKIQTMESKTTRQMRNHKKG